MCLLEPDIIVYWSSMNMVLLWQQHNIPQFELCIVRLQRASECVQSLPSWKASTTLKISKGGRNPAFVWSFARLCGERLKWVEIDVGISTAIHVSSHKGRRLRVFQLILSSDDSPCIIEKDFSLNLLKQGFPYRITLCPWLPILKHIWCRQPVPIGYLSMIL